MRALQFVATVFLVGLSSGAAHAAAPGFGALSAGEREGLIAGDIVSRPMRFQTDHGRYLGGISYSVVHAPVAAVMAALSNVQTWPQALPRTQAARLIDVRRGVARVELVQGGGALAATYTVQLERTPDGSELRFWLDDSRPHDIDDVFGFFRVEPFGESASLVTVAAAIDVGSGMASLLFSAAIERAVLASPQQIRDYVQPRVFALLGSG